MTTYTHDQWQAFNARKRVRRQHQAALTARYAKMEADTLTAHGYTGRRTFIDLFTCVDLDLTYWATLVAVDNHPDPARDPARYQFWQRCIRTWIDFYRSDPAIPYPAAKDRASDLVKKAIEGVVTYDGTPQKGLHAWLQAQGRAGELTHCPVCQQGYSANPEAQRQLDHRLPIKRGGTNSLPNFGYLCRKCNREKFMAHASEWKGNRDEGA